MTPPDLQSLAADCEARAAAGVKPSFLEWEEQKEWDENLDAFQPFNEPWRDIICISRSYPRDEPMKYQVTWWGAPGDGECEHHSPDLSSLAAAQLFAEALLRRATLALHPPPARAAHVEAFAAKVLAAMQEFGRTAGDADAWMCELGDMAMKSGFLCEPPEWNLTDLGRQLLADAATLARPTEAPDAKP